jgi:hypothetical protein
MIAKGLLHVWDSEIVRIFNLRDLVFRQITLTLVASFFQQS